MKASTGIRVYKDTKLLLANEVTLEAKRVYPELRNINLSMPELLAIVVKYFLET